MAGARWFPAPGIPGQTSQRGPPSGKLRRAVRHEVARQAERSRPVRLMFQGECRFGLPGSPRRCRAPRGQRPAVGARLERKYIYALHAVSPHDGLMGSQVPPWANARTISMSLAEVAQQCEDGQRFAWDSCRHDHGRARTAPPSACRAPQASAAPCTGESARCAAPRSMFVFYGYSCRSQGGPCGQGRGGGRRPAASRGCDRIGACPSCGCAAGRAAIDPPVADFDNRWRSPLMKLAPGGPR